MRTAYKIAIVVIAIAMLLGGMALYIRNQSGLALQNLNATQNQSVTGPISITASASQSQVFSYNSSLAVYSLLSYNVSNAQNASVSMSLYSQDPFKRIYLLNVSAYCIACFDENVLRSSLQSSLAARDLLRNSTSFNYINVSDLDTIGGGSIVIIPSGLLPIFMLNGTSPQILSLLGKGDVIIYTGLNFSSSVGPNGLIFVNDPNTLAALAASGLGMQQYGSSVRQPYYSANFSFNKPTFVFSTGFRYGNSTYVNAVNGTMIAFSNYPTTGWGSTYAMAADISDAIAARFWMQKIGASRTTLNVGSRSSGSIGVFAQVMASNVTRLPPAEAVNGTFALITLQANNSGSNATRAFVLQNSYTPLGSVTVPSPIGETQNIPIVIKINNSSQNLLVHLDLYDRNLSYSSSIPIGFVSGPLGVVKYHAFTIPGGYYIAELKDFNNNYYGSALFNLSSAVITPTTLDFKNGVFLFSVFSNGLPVNNATYQVNINGAYSSEGAINNGVINYTLPKGTLVAYGTERFNFYIFNTNITYVSSYQQSIVNIPPIFIEFGIVLVVVILLNLILKPPNKDEYYIDVPEFPPSKREKVKVPKSSVLGVFDKVNYYHRWKYMPLTAEEIKSGVSNNIRANNMPISITTQNADRILASLVHDGSLSSVSGYYAPATWTEASNHSVEYLTIFRKMRDYCVSHAILFTDLDSNDTADLLITKDGKQMGVFIYTKAQPMRKLTISNDSKVVIVFLDDDSMRGFVDDLHSSYGKGAEVLKLGIEYNYVKLLDSDHLDQLVL